MIEQAVSIDHRLQRMGCILISLAFITVGLETLVAVPLGILTKTTDVSLLGKLIISTVISSIVFVVGIIAVKWVARKDLLLMQRAYQLLIDNIWVAILLGLVLRTIVIFFANVTPVSDAKVYTELGQILADGQQYYFSHRWAYWPVGYPFLLSVWFRIFNSSLLGIQILNLLLYLFTCFGISILATILVQPKAGKLAVWLFALWPDIAVLTAWPSKELVVIALMPWMVAFCLLSCSSQRSMIGSHVGAGIIAGMLVLVQPSFLLLIPVLPILSLFVWCRKPREIVFGTIVFMVIAMAIVAPWTVRNYLVLNAFVPVATNGGEVLYRANNSLATGGYIKQGEVDLWHMPELEAHRTGIRLAKEWIMANPRDFLLLALRKQFLFLEDDSIGVYEVLRRGKLGPPLQEHTYFAWKFFCVAYWYLLWSLFSAALFIVIREGVWERLVSLFVASPFLYLYTIHSIFESGPRYHQPASAVLILAMSATILEAIRSVRATVKISAPAIVTT